MSGHRRNCLTTLGILALVQILVQAAVLDVFPESDTYSHIATIEEAREVDDEYYGYKSRIVDGNPAVLGQLPWQVSLRQARSDGVTTTCGGTFIHHQWVITAAHCTADKVIITVRLGTVNLTTPSLVLETRTWYDHPGFDRRTLNHDISLIDLGRHVEYTQYIQPIRIQSAVEAARGFAGLNLRASGFGLTNSSAVGGVLPEVLSYVDLRGITPAECSSFYGSSTVIYSVVCTRNWDESSKNICSGDSGGPLVHYDDNNLPTLVGAVCFGSSQGCHINFPAGYVGVGFYHPWLQSVTGINFNIAT